MGKQSDSSITTKMKVWTIVCILFACGAAFLLRGVLVYKAFPLYHEELIAKYSAEYDIDKYLVCAVISTESGFDEIAVSSRGATGLMQIMPDTGVWAAEKIGIDSIEDLNLQDPETNIRIGCWYLNHLGKMFNNDSRIVLASYNAGPAKVKSWLDADGTLRDIPYEETENYVQRVSQKYNIYKGLYNDF
jgi:soluble lytic murein transglycosylase